MDCDHLVTLFILYQESSKRKLCLIHYHTESQLWRPQQKILMPTITLTKAGEAGQTAYLFSEQTRSFTAEGEPGKENGPNEAGGYFPA